MAGTMTWIRETRAAARNLARRPGFSAVAILTLALGIGATVAIFTVVNAVLLRPLAYPDSESIVSVRHHAPGLDLPELQSSQGLANFYGAHGHMLESFALYSSDERNLTGGDRPARVRLAVATPSLFQVLGVHPAQGRAFTREDAGPEGPGVVVLLHDAWTSRFGADPDILGRTLELDGRTVEVVGVMPPEFEMPSPGLEAILPLHVEADAEFGTFGLDGIGRAAPGTTVAEARREIEALQPRIAEYFPDLTPAFFEQAGWSVSVETLKDRMVGEARTGLWVVLATVALVLLIACANVANLFLVRAEARQREVAVRAALGAGRGRLAIAFLSESVLVGLSAGVVGVAAAAWGVRGLVAWGPPQLPRLQEIGMDVTVLGFALAVSVVAGLAFGSLPVVRYLGRSFARVLREGPRGATDGRREHRARNVLVAGQLALALVLLVGSGLMLRTFHEIRSVELGFDPEGVLAVGLSVGNEPGRVEAADLYQSVRNRLAALPGVEAVGATNSLPVDLHGLNGGSFAIRSRPTPEDQLKPVTMHTAVTEGFFQAMSIPLLEGRDVERADHEAPRPVAWVNESFARAFFDGDAGDALGEQIYLGEYDVDRTDPDSLPWMEIVGVVGDVRHFGLREELRPLAYFPMRGPADARIHLAGMSFVLRTAGDPTGLVPAVRAAVGEVDAGVPLTRVRTMEAVLAESLAATSFTMVLLGIAVGMALLLGAVGVYGVISYVVSRRTREIGVRMALGARGDDVRSMVLRQGMVVAGVGIALGLVAALALTRFMAGLLFEVSATDPLTFAAVTAALAGVAALASWLPARRATRVDPVRALMAE